MTKLMKLEHNVETGEVIEREMTDAEYETYQKMLVIYAEQAEVAAQAEAAKQAAQAKLAALGLTVDDLAALGL